MQDDLEEFKLGKTVEKEIIELHQFFEDWFNGDILEDVTRFTSTMAEDFELIPPSGEKLSRTTIISLIGDGYNTQTGRKIWVEDISTKLVGDLIIATYYELQIVGGNETKRLSSAVFSFDPNTPNKCCWHHVHETWV